MLSKNDLNSLQNWLGALKEFQLDSMFDTNVLGRAYLVTPSVSILESLDNKVTGQIEDGKYALEIISIDGEIHAECSCPFDGNCKHLAALLILLII